MRENTKKIAVIGMLLALQVVAGRFCTIELPIAKVGFVFLPLSLTAILYGPLWGGAAGVMGDFLAAALGPYGYYPPMATTAFLSGCIYGLFLYRKPLTVWRIAACVLTECILCSVLLQTFWLTLLMDKAYMVLLPTRLTQNLIVAPISVLLIRVVAPRVVAVVNGGPMAPAKRD